jgi:glutamate racemase
MLNMQTPAKIAVFDSGFGGLTVLSELRRVLPSANFYYLGDSARAPYGTKGPETIARYGRDCVTFLMRYQPDLIVVACNTVSSIALGELSEMSSVPIIGTIEPAIDVAFRRSTRGRFGVLGTRATIASGAYQRGIESRWPDALVQSVACPLFVPLVEEGLTDHRMTVEAIQMYLQPLREAEIDTVVLGCTHYPLLLPALTSFFGAEVALIQCSTAIAERAEEMLRKSLEDSEAPEGALSFFTTDDVERFNLLGSRFLGGMTVSAQLVRLEG